MQLRAHTLRVAGELTIGALAQRSGVAASALRFYQDRGLIRAERTQAGHRRYSRSTIRRVAFIVFAQKIGLSLEEVGRELGRLPDGRVPTSDDWTALSGRWVRRVDERIAELQRLRTSLTGCIGCGCLSLEACRLANPGDRVSRRGAGPRYWIDSRSRTERQR